jgi:excinuclease ABC subunit A
MADPVIRIVNARQHNLRGLTVDLPRRKLIVVTGPSGSGKSSLAFDTLYAEGQRRYIESLSTYAKQFLERMPKPLVDRLEGLAPAVAIEQRNPTVSSRSTVGTATEIYDYLRLLWARVGRQRCRKCGAPVRRDTPQSAADETGTRVAGAVQIAFPLPESARHSHAAIVENLRALGFVRLLGDGVEYHLDALPATVDLTRCTELLIVVDRLMLQANEADTPSSAPARLTAAIETAFGEGEGIALVLHRDGRLRFTEHPACSRCDTPAATVTPALFSFNNPRGACGGCNGFGAVLEYDESLVIPDPTLTLSQGVINPDRRATGATPPPAAQYRSPSIIRTSPGDACRTRNAGAASWETRPLHRNLSFPQGSGGEALQAVHPGLPAAVPAGPYLPGLSWQPAQRTGPER